MNNKVCPSCGRENSSDTLYCVNCGLKFGENNELVCPNCNNKIEANNNFCLNCGHKLKEITNNQVVVNESDSEGNKLGIISLCLYFFGPFILGVISYFFPRDFSQYISSLGGLSSLAAIVIMIVGRVKYPTNKLLKIIMWIYIGLIAASIVLFIAIFLFCFITCSTMDTSGCS